MAAVTAADGTGTVLASCAGPTQVVELWDAADGERLARIERAEFGNAAVRALAAALLEDGTPVVLVGDGEGDVHLLRARTGQPAAESARPHGRRPHLAASAALVDGRELIAVASGSGVHCFDARTGEPLDDPHRPWPVAVNALATARLADGRVLLVAAHDDGIARRDATTGADCPPHPDEKTNTIWDLVTVPLPDGRVLVAGAGHDWRIHRWDAETGAALGAPLEGHRISVKAIAVTTLPDAPDRPVLVTGCERGEVRRWDAATGAQLGETLDVGKNISELAVVEGPSDRRMLVCGDLAGVIHRWDLVAGTPLGPPVELGRWPWSLGTFTTPQGVAVQCVGVPDRDEQDRPRPVACLRLDDGQWIELPGIPEYTFAVLPGGGEPVALSSPVKGSVRVSRIG